MSNLNIFQNSSKTIPTSDPQIVRIDMSQAEIGGRKSHMPSQMVSDKLPLSHVPNAGSSVGK